MQTMPAEAAPVGGDKCGPDGVYDCYSGSVRPPVHERFEYFARSYVYATAEKGLRAELKASLQSQYPLLATGRTTRSDTSNLRCSHLGQVLSKYLRGSA